MTLPWMEMRGKEEERYNKMTISELQELVPQVGTIMQSKTKNGMELNYVSIVQM